MRKLKMLLTLAVVTLVGCMAEDNDDCTRYQVRVVVDTHSSDARIGDVVLYIFDAKGNFLESRQTQINRSEPIEYPGAERFTFVALCNAGDGTVDVVSPQIGEMIQSGMVTLKSAATTKAPIDIYSEPGDILWGAIKDVKRYELQTITINTSRKVASVGVTVRGLKSYAGFDDNNYSIVIARTKKTMDFTGTMLGDGVGYRPVSSFNPSSELVAPIFRLFPSTGETLSVRVMHGQDVVYEAFRDSQGYVLQAIENQTLNVLIDLTDISNAQVTMVNSKWGDVYNWEKVIP